MSVCLIACKCSFSSSKTQHACTNANDCFTMQSVLLPNTPINGGWAVLFTSWKYIFGKVCDIWMIPSIGGTIHFADKDALKGSLLKTLTEVHPTRYIMYYMCRLWSLWLWSLSNEVHCGDKDVHPDYDHYPQAAADDDFLQVVKAIIENGLWKKDKLSEFRFVAVPRVFEKMHSQLETQLDQVAHHHLWFSPCLFHHLTTILYLLWLRMYMLSWTSDNNCPPWIKAWLVFHPHHFDHCLSSPLLTLPGHRPESFTGALGSRLRHHSFHRQHHQQSLFTINYDNMMIAGVTSNHYESILAGEPPPSPMQYKLAEKLLLRKVFLIILTQMMLN